MVTISGNFDGALVHVFAVLAPVDMVAGATIIVDSTRLDESLLGRRPSRLQKPQE